MNANTEATAELKVGVAGFFKLRKGVINEDGSETITGETPWFSNLITDAGLDMMATAQSQSTGEPMNAVQVGTGSSTPSFSDTTLSNRRAGTTSNSPGGTGQGDGKVVGPPRYGWKRIAKRFGQGVAAGNLTEIGVSNGVNTTLFSRALILDGSGNPTTLTVLETEFLDVVYECRLYLPTAETTGTATISGVTYNLTIRPTAWNDTYQWAPGIPCLTVVWVSGYGPSIGLSSGAAPAMYDSVNYNLAPKQSATGLAYTSGNYYRDYQYTWGINVGNGNIRVVGIASGIGEFAFIFDPVIPKDNTKSLTLVLRLRWGRYTP